jgi:putative serine protease PepD
MVAPEFFEPHINQEPAASSPSSPSSPPPGRRFSGRLAAGVLAVALVAGGGSGVLTSTLLSHGTPTSTAATSGNTNSTLSSTSQSNDTAGVAQAVYKSVAPGVVTITAQVAGRFGQVGQATGSGIVLDSKGNILTNYHVIAGAQQVSVKFSDGSTGTATVVGSNPGYDLAVLRASVSASSLHPVTLGDSGTIQVGDSVYAIGAPFGLSGTLTEGIVSALNRGGSSATASGSIGSTLSSLIQTDTAINPGNSGGALVNAQGQVIGVTQSIDSPVDGNVGVGFAIPINQVKQLLPSLESGSNL